MVTLHLWQSVVSSKHWMWLYSQSVDTELSLHYYSEMNKIENITTADIGIKTNTDVYIYIASQLVLWIFGIGGNLLVFVHQNMCKRKCLTVPLSALSSLDFLMCCILACILFSNTNQWLPVNICHMDQILFTRLIVILRIAIRISKSFHNVLEKVLSVFHAYIVMPLYVLCILDEDNSQIPQGTQETILHCKEFPQKAFGICTLFIEFGSCLIFIGTSTNRKYLMKNTFISTEIDG